MSRGVPVVDIGALRDDGLAAERDRTVSLIASACRDFGFFQVVGHGVSEGLLDRVWEQTHRFFDQPRPAKLVVSRSAENPRGYYDRELTKNARDLKEVFDFAAVPHPHLPESHPDNRATVDGFNQWPEAIPGFRDVMLEYFGACQRLGLELLAALCEGLGVDAQRLTRHFTGHHSSFVRLNYYPLEDPLDSTTAAQVTELGDMALHHHTDSGALTILLQDDVGGLQVEVDGDWVDVEPVTGALVINVGDMMQVWSNDAYRAALHRVRPVRGRARYSLPFFFNPSYDTDYAPLTPESVAKYRAINWGEFRRLRTAGDYADHGKEVQIEDYRIG